MTNKIYESIGLIWRECRSSFKSFLSSRVRTLNRVITLRFISILACVYLVIYNVNEVIYIRIASPS